MRIVHDSVRGGHTSRMFLRPLVVIVALLAGWAVIADWHQLPSALTTTMAQMP
jgi:hypothetical protein